MFHFDVYPLLNELMGLFVTACVGLVVKFLKAHFDIKKLENELKSKSAYADIAVQFVEQVYKDIHGKEKFDKAAQWLSEQFAKKGLTVTEEELEALVEAAVQKLKNGVVEGLK